MSTPVSTIPSAPQASLQSPPIPQGVGSASTPSTAPARIGATQRDGSSSLGTFGVRVLLVMRLDTHLTVGLTGQIRFGSDVESMLIGPS